MAEIIDDKSPHCLPFILSLHDLHPSPSPLLIGLNGVQGAGKTTLVSSLCTTLRTQYGLETLVLSLDDLYLAHADQTSLAQQHPENPLLQHRGEPGTHDIPLATDLFSRLRAGSPARIPRYDKSAFSGRGDRVPPAQWTAVNQPGQPSVQVVILEGWCLGFRALAAEAVRARWEAAREDAESALGRNRLEDLLCVNEMLRGYDGLTDGLDAFIHVDAEETRFVYEWRLQQEVQLRRERGVENAMTDEQVRSFVDGYYPAYELYTENLRRGVFQGVPEKKGCQLRLVVGRDRGVKSVEQI